jgi:hypothetical protein
MTNMYESVFAWLFQLVPSPLGAQAVSGTCSLAPILLDPAIWAVTGPRPLPILFTGGHRNRDL